MKAVSIILLMLLVLGAIAVLVLHLVHRSRGGTPEQVEAKAELRHAKAHLAALEREQRSRVRTASRLLKQAQGAFDREVKLATLEVARLEDPRGAQLASYRGVVVYERWIVTPHGQGPLSGTTASVDAQVSSRITMTRLVAIGVFALAAQKKTGSVYLSIDSPALASVIECPAEDNTRARQFAVAIMNAARQAAVIEVSRPLQLKAARERLERAKVDTGRIETARTELHEVETDEQYLADRASRQAAFDQAEHTVARLGGKGPAAMQG
jgi:hypothetical protein